MMRQTAGGETAQGIIDEYPNPAPVVQVELPAAEVERILGMPLAVEEIVRILEALEFRCEVKGQAAASVLVTAPDHRIDIGTGVVGQADLIEEIARIYGYDRIPETQIGDTVPPQLGNPGLEREERARDLLVHAGLQSRVDSVRTRMENMLTRFFTAGLYQHPAPAS